MKHMKIVSVIAMIAVIGGIVGAAWALNNNSESTAETPPTQTMPKLNIDQDIRDDAMAYIKANHPETAQFMNNLNWTGGAVETFAPPATYIYNSPGWTVMIQESTKNSPGFSINAEYTAQGIGIPYHMTWTGNLQEGTISETSFNLAQ
jgi:hypothetical protein